MKIEKILLIDDDNISNFISKMTISKIKLSENITIKNNGFEGLDYIRQCISNEKYPDLILLDLKMPGMDGFEFLKEFEKLEAEISNQIVIVVLTSSKAKEDLTRLHDIGPYYLINKPLTPDSLKEIYQRFFIRDKHLLKLNSEKLV